MKAKRIMSTVLAAGLLMAFTGCGSKDSGSSSYESGFTTAELAERISIDGVRLKAPMTFADFGEGFKLDSYIQEGEGSSAVDIFNKDGVVCALEYYLLKPDEVNENTPISSIRFMPTDFNREVVSIDGFTANDSPEVIEEKLGKPTESQEYLRCYDTSDGGRLEIVDIAGKVFAINFYFDDPEKSEEAKAIYRN